ncbi:MAG TPA: TRAP transporter small permease subunit [Candidatus Methylomirabilis sp.]|jgi:TRAP-type transport system small permease protein
MVKQILAGYDRVLRFVITWLMILLVIPVTLQIVSRYTELIPRYIWTEEAARFLFIWIIMIGSILAVRDETHFNVDVLPKPKTARGKALATLWVDLAILLMAAIFVWFGTAFVKFGYSQTSELTGINMVFIFGSFLLAGVSWVAVVAERTIANLPVLIGGAHGSR